MTKESLKVGDRVRVYGFVQNAKGWSATFWGGQSGTVTKLMEHVVEPGGVEVELDKEKQRVFASVAQCRRLRPKKKPLRVSCEVTMKVTPDGIIYPSSGSAYWEHVYDSMKNKRGTLVFTEGESK